MDYTNAETPNPRRRGAVLFEDELDGAELVVDYDVHLTLHYPFRPGAGAGSVSVALAQALDRLGNGQTGIVPESVRFRIERR